MHTRFVGDVHGKVEAVERALDFDGPVIFVGDFIDSFDRSPKDHDRCYQLVIDAIKRGKAQAIFGNHELSYLQPFTHKCSGYDFDRCEVVRKHEGDILALFKPYILLDELLVSHAGLTKQIWDEFNLTVENLTAKLDSWWRDDKSPMHWIGYSRGGINPVGGLFWCDFNDDFKPIPELAQVFGHTRGKGIRQKENAFCIDCLHAKVEFLNIET